MRVIKLQNDIYQFSSYFEPVNFTFNQFLLTGTSSILVQTGPVFITKELISQVQKILAGRKLSYVFISHFESDECGGLGLFLSQFPDVKAICSETTARQLSGFGITNNTLSQKPGEIFKTEEYEFEFIAYPSEMHMWEGLVLFEKKSGILFSSDLFIQFGKAEKEFIESDWKEQVNSLGTDRFLPPAEVPGLQSALSELPVSVIAPGHGACIKL